MYKPQVYKIINIIKRERALRRVREKIKINTVDAFQGSECDFIIINTVRSNGDGDIGFLVNEKRLNVAISRAKFGVLMIGNRDTLARVRTNEIWPRIIDYFQQIDPPQDPDANLIVAGGGGGEGFIRNFADFNDNEEGASDQDGESREDIDGSSIQSSHSNDDRQYDSQEYFDEEGEEEDIDDENSNNSIDGE